MHYVFHSLLRCQWDVSAKGGKRNFQDWQWKRGGKSRAREGRGRGVKVIPSHSLMPTFRFFIVLFRPHLAGVKRVVVFSLRTWVVYWEGGRHSERGLEKKELIFIRAFFRVGGGIHRGSSHWREEGRKKIKTFHALPWRKGSLLIHTYRDIPEGKQRRSTPSHSKPPSLFRDFQDSWKTPIWGR